MPTYTSDEQDDMSSLVEYNSGNDYTVKKIEIIMSCNIVKDEYVSIQINTLYD